MRSGTARHGAWGTVLLTTGALLAGCATSSADPAKTALSQTELAAKAAAICGPAGKQIEAAAHRFLGDGEPSASDFEQFVTAAVVPETQRVIDGLEGLTPPSSDARTYGALLGQLQSVNDRLKANPMLLTRDGDPFAKSNRLAKQLGLDACATD